MVVVVVMMMIMMMMMMMMMMASNETIIMMMSHARTRLEHCYHALKGRQLREGATRPQLHRFAAHLLRGIEREAREAKQPVKEGGVRTLLCRWQGEEVSTTHTHTHTLTSSLRRRERPAC